MFSMMIRTEKGEPAPNATRFELRSRLHARRLEENSSDEDDTLKIGRGDDTVGNPHRAHFSQFFKLIILLELDKQFSIEQFEPTVSQSTIPSPPLRKGEWPQWGRSEPSAGDMAFLIGRTFEN